MKKEIMQKVAAVTLGFVLSSGVVILEETSGLNSFAIDENNGQIQTVDRLNADPEFPPPPPPPPPGGGLTR